jgi:phospholipid/cholesterol/gamma-HCH transport system permease protein
VDLGRTKPKIVGLPQHDRGLLEEMHGVNREPLECPRARTGSSARWLPSAPAPSGRDLMLFADMLGAVGVATARVLVRPREFRFTSTVNQLDRVAWQAVPIILLITF